MPRVGFGELLVIGFVLLVVLSASRMAALGNAVGKFVYSFRKAARGEGFIDAQARTLPRAEADTSETHPPQPPNAEFGLSLYPENGPDGPFAEFKHATSSSGSAR